MQNGTLIKQLFTVDEVAERLNLHVKTVRRFIREGRLPAKRILAASLAQLGRLDEAREEARRFREINPGFQVCNWAATQPFERHEDREHFADGYIKAGLPR